MPLLLGALLAAAAAVYVLQPLLRRSGNAARRDCPACGARPEPDAVFCSTCGRDLRA